MKIMLLLSCWLFVMISLAWMHDARPKEEGLEVHFILVPYTTDIVKPCTIADDICWDYVRSRIGAHWWQGGKPLGKCFVPDSRFGANAGCLDDVLEHN